MKTHEALAAWRAGLGLQQYEAAALAMIPQSAWSLIERGRRQPTLAQAFRIERLTAGVRQVKAVQWMRVDDRRKFEQVVPARRAA